MAGRLPLVAVVSLGLFALPPGGGAALQPNCVLVAPVAPLSGAGLATPYRLSGCSETDAGNAAFVQASIYDPSAHSVSVYNPLVVTGSAAPAAAPTPVTLAAGAVVALWVGSNSSVKVTEDDPAYPFVQGTTGSLFTQQSYLNVPAFLSAVNGDPSVVIPPLGTAADGEPCPSPRDFSIVDQDQSDNTTTQYLITPSGRTAQDTPANRAALGTAITFNGSDERLLTAKVDRALNCSPWKVADLADTSGTLTSTDGLLEEVQAAADQAAPVALVPSGDPFTLRKGAPNLAKLNAYRQQVDQSAVASLAEADTAAYCSNMLGTGEPRLKLDQPLTNAISSPFPLIADSTGTFLAYRFDQSWSLLGCQRLIGVASPVSLTYSDGVVVGATYR